MATHLWIFCSSERRKLLMGWNRRSSWWIVSMLGKALHLLVFLFLCFLFIHLRASVCGCGDSHMKSSAYCSTNYMTKNCTNYLIEDILEQLLELCKALFFPPPLSTRSTSTLNDLFQAMWGTTKTLHSMWRHSFHLWQQSKVHVFVCYMAEHTHAHKHKQSPR